MSEKQAVERLEQTTSTPTTLWNTKVMRYGPSIGVLGAMSMEWFYLSAPFVGTISGTGFDMGISSVCIATVVGLIGATYFKPEYDYITRIFGGGLLSILSVWKLFDIWAAMDQAQTQLQGNMFADTVSMGVGLGLYLMILVSVLIAYSGYALKSQ